MVTGSTCRPMIIKYTSLNILRVFIFIFYSTSKTSFSTRCKWTQMSIVHSPQNLGREHPLEEQWKSFQHRINHFKQLVLWLWSNIHGNRIRFFSNYALANRCPGFDVEDVPSPEMSLSSISNSARLQTVLPLSYSEGATPYVAIISKIWLFESTNFESASAKMFCNYRLFLIWKIISNRAFWIMVSSPVQILKYLIKTALWLEFYLGPFPEVKLFF